MPAASSTAIEMRLTGTDQASALLDAATQKLARLNAVGKNASSGIAAAAAKAGRALLWDGPAAAIRAVRRGLVATAAAAAAAGYAADRAAARFGTLSDQAAQAGASADELSRLSLALQQAGVRAASVDGLAAALGRMAKATGRTGLAGLRETLAEIAAMPDEASRVVALADTFGRSLGPQFAALVRQGPDALREGLDGVVAAMPGLSNALVAAGDSVADGMLSIRTAIRDGWDSTLVAIATRVAELFGADSFRELGARIGAYVRYYADVVIANIGPLWDHLKFWAASLPRLFVAGVRDIGEVIDTAIVDRLGWIGRRLHDLRDAVAMISGAAGAASAGDWEGAWEALVTRPAERAGTHVGEVLGEFTGRAWAGATDEAAARLAESLAASSRLDDAMDKLSSGVPAPFEQAQAEADALGKAGAGAAKKIADAWRGTGVVMAGSYEALRLSMQRTARAASAVATSATFAPASSGSAVAGSDLASLVQLQREGWSFLRSSLSALGVV